MKFLLTSLIIQLNTVEKGKEIKIANEKEGHLNIVSISDQGVGIPKEFIHRITRKYFLQLILVKVGVLVEQA